MQSIAPKCGIKRCRLWTVVVLLFIVLERPACSNAASLLQTILSDSSNNLRAASELARRDRAAFQRVLGNTRDAVVLIPTDTAWKKHSRWLAVALYQPRLRHRLGLGGIGIAAPDTEIVDDREGVVLSTFTSNYIIYSDTPSANRTTMQETDEEPPSVCLLDTSGPELHISRSSPSCANITDVISADDATALLVDDVVLKESLRVELTLSGVRTPYHNEALELLGETL